MASAATPAPDLATRISVGSAALLGACWVAIHLVGIFAVDLAVAPWWGVVPLVLAQAWLSTGLFIVAHDCMHGSFAPGRPALNRAVGRFCLMIYAGLDYDRLLPAHHKHHSHVGTADDPDFHAPDPTKPLPWLISFFHGYYTHAQLLRITLAACVWMLLGAQLLNIAVFWAVPALLALGQLFYFGTFLPHRHAEAFADHHNARSTRLPHWASALTCFHFGGYHHEHHLHPRLPWWALPGARLAERDANT